MYLIALFRAVEYMLSEKSTWNDDVKQQRGLFSGTRDLHGRLRHQPEKRHQF